MQDPSAHVAWSGRQVLIGGRGVVNGAERINVPHWEFSENVAST